MSLFVPTIPLLVITGHHIRLMRLHKNQNTTNPMLPIQNGLLVMLLGMGCTAVASLLAVMAPPGAQDVASVMGAIFASTIAGISARTTFKTSGHVFSVLIASAFVGSVLPGILVGYYTPKFWNELTWHAWAGMGFVCGLLGWTFTHAIMTTVSKAFEKWFERKVNSQIETIDRNDRKTETIKIRQSLKPIDQIIDQKIIQEVEKVTSAQLGNDK